MKVSSLPLIRFSDLKYWFSFNKNQIKIKNYNFCYWNNSSAEAIAKICKNLIAEKDRKISILVPYYFCGQSLRYLRELNVVIIFYELNDDLTPNFSLLKSNSQNIKFDLILHVHYFGRLIKPKISKEFAQQFNALLIEDCAHIVTPYINFSFEGDFLVFSPHKHFALPQISFTLSKKIFDKKRSNISYKFPLVWLLKQILKKYFRTKYQTFWGIKWSEESVPLNNKYTNSLVRNAAKNMIINSKYYVEKRKMNSQILIKKLIEIPKWKPIFKYDDEIAPYLLGMICDDKYIAKRRFLQFNKNFPMVMQWPDLPKELLDINKKLSDQSILMVSKTLFFFVHHDIDIKYLIEQIDKIQKDMNL